MNKPLLVFYGPVDTFSGYGARSRDIVKSLIKSDKYEVKIISCNWGQTPHDFLNPNNEEHKQILDCIIPNMSRQPDIWVMNTIPSEMQKVGKYNILITAGIETTLVDPSWIEGCNRADLVLVSSEHAKNVFQNSAYEKRNNQTQQPEGILKINVPIEVLFEGANIYIYNNRKEDCYAINGIHDELDKISENFCYLYVGHWLQGELGEDRKNVGGLIKTFLETFKNKTKKPALILKTQMMSPSCMDREEILERINHIQKLVGGKDLPPIYLIHGDLSDYDMNELYNHPKVKAHVSFTKGEGFGRPLLEASLSAKPVIASNWSGQIDFLKAEFNQLIGGTLTNVHPSAIVPNIIIENSKWFTVDYKQASKILEDVFTKYEKYLEGAKRQAYRSKTEFSLDKMQEKLTLILDEKIPKYQPLILPTLKKIQLPTLNKVSE